MKCNTQQRGFGFCVVAFGEDEGWMGVGLGYLMCGAKRGVDVF